MRDTTHHEAQPVERVAIEVLDVVGDQQDALPPGVLGEQGQHCHTQQHWVGRSLGGSDAERGLECPPRMVGQRAEVGEEGEKQLVQGREGLSRLRLAALGRQHEWSVVPRVADGGRHQSRLARTACRPRTVSTRICGMPVLHP
ncbi:hypothetical protein [Streptomyces sp. AC550_RSS872]|uniref:hypothetical protein n=1 Tax=Streptomyces sp. AC550_RSS872 TaxID=2823689 RepID=UPI001C25F0BE|nr:hypothetical protein [Streptomyces sp. AC550_RSS872]